MSEKIATGHIPEKQRLSMTIHPMPGHLISAQTLGEKLCAMNELLEICAKRESGTDRSKIYVGIDDLRMSENGALTVGYCILPVTDGYQKDDSETEEGEG